MLWIGFDKLFKLYDQFQPMKAGLKIIFTGAILLSALRLATYIVYQWFERQELVIIVIFFFTVFIDLSLNGFVLYYSEKKTDD